MINAVCLGLIFIYIMISVGAAIEEFSNERLLGGNKYDCLCMAVVTIFFWPLVVGIAIIRHSNKS